MGDALKKVTAGSPLAIPAAAYNAFIDAARAEQAHQGDQGVPGQAIPRESGIVLIKNTTESDLDRFAILGIDAPIFTPTDNEQEFKNRVALKGVTPDTEEDEHYGRFAILLEPLAAGRIGLGMVQGVTPVRLRRYTDWLRSADIQDGKTGYLCDKIGGIAKILWCEEGVSENEEDLKWAVVAFRGGGTVGASYVWRAQVTGVYAADGGAWVSYAADGWQAYVTANPLYQNGEPDEETTLLLKLTADCAEGEVGFKDVAGGDRVGYIIATDTSDVPGQPSGTKYDGWVILHGEDDGATLAALQHAAGGPGITVDDTTDPFEPKISVDLADPSGLEFDAGGDDGRLKAKPDTARGLDLDGSGIFIDLAATPGLEFSGGDLKVLPDGDEGIKVDAQGVGVKLAASNPGLQFDGGGLQAKPYLAHAICVTGDGIGVNINHQSDGLEFDSNVLKVYPDEEQGIELTGNGGVGAKVYEYRGLEVDAIHGIGIALAGGEGDGNDQSGLEFDSDNGVRIVKSYEEGSDNICFCFYEEISWYEYTVNGTTFWAATELPTLRRVDLQVTADCTGRIRNMCVQDNP